MADAVSNEDMVRRGKIRRPPSERTEGGVDQSISSKLLLAANFWRRSGNAYYRQHFNVSITEVHVLMVLDAHAPLSLNAMAASCGIDKAQMSRCVKQLVARQLVRHGRSRRNGSEIELSLDYGGVRLSKEIKQAAKSRLAALLRSFSDEEIVVLRGFMDRLIDNAGDEVVAVGKAASAADGKIVDEMAADGRRPPREDRRAGGVNG